MKILTKKCFVCGKEYAARKKEQKYCSTPCRGSGIRKGKPSWNKGLPKTWKSPGDFKKGQIPWNKGKKGLQVAWIKGKHHSEETKQKLREARLKQVMVRKDTSIEVKTENELKLRNISFIKQFSLEKVCVADFYLPKYKIVIFCDGDYWHNLPSYKVRDKRINETLRDNGYKVFRFWEHEIEKSVSDCIDKLCIPCHT